MAFQGVGEDKREMMKTLYIKGLLPLSEIAKRLGLSRQSVWNILKQMGVDTTKRKIVLECSECKQLVSKTRAEVRKHEHHFCDSGCYAMWMRRPETHHEIREAEVLRDSIEENFQLSPEMALFHDSNANDTYIFPTREAMLEWKRTGLPQLVISTKLRKESLVKRYSQPNTEGKK